METQRVTAGGPTASQSQFTRDEAKGVTRFSNRVQGLAYGGASFLVVIVGLRSIYGRQMPTGIVIGALVLEACLLLMIALVYYMTPEEKGGSAPSTDSQLLTGEKEILQLLKRDIIGGENEMLKILKNDVAGGTHELVSLMRNEVLTSQREMYNALRAEIMKAGSEALQVLQRTEGHAGKMNDLLSSQYQANEALRTEFISGEAEALRVLQRIESHISKVVENEIERVVQQKVQEVFTSMVRQEVHKSLEANRTAKS